MTQKFHRGDLVHVAKDLGKSMSHFTNDIDAIVIGSYAEQYGGGRNSPSYTLHLKGMGHCSWYDEHQLTLLESDRADLLEKWEAEEEAEHELHSGLDWIFANAKQVIENPPGSSLQSLANCLKLGSLWGSRGEGYQYYINAHTIHDLATPYLEANDRVGWDEMCTKYLEQT